MTTISDHGLQGVSPSRPRCYFLAPQRGRHQKSSIRYPKKIWTLSCCPMSFRELFLVNYNHQEVRQRLVFIRCSATLMIWRVFSLQWLAPVQEIALARLSDDLLNCGNGEMKLRSFNVCTFVAVGSGISLLLAGFANNALFHIGVQTDLKANEYTTHN